VCRGWEPQSPELRSTAAPECLPSPPLDPGGRRGALVMEVRGGCF